MYNQIKTIRIVFKTSDGKAGCWGHPAFPVQNLKGGKKRDKRKNLLCSPWMTTSISIAYIRVFCVNELEINYFFSSAGRAIGVTI